LLKDCYFNQLKSFDCCRHNTSYRNAKKLFSPSAAIRHQTCVEEMYLFRRRKTLLLGVLAFFKLLEMGFWKCDLQMFWKE
jgi:hypothetical protein